MRRMLLIILMIAMLTGSALAASNVYTQSGSVALPGTTSFATSNTYDSSKITSMNISVTPTYTHVDTENLSGCIAHWKLDETTGTTAVNSVNSSNNGNVSGSAGNAVWNTTGGKYNGSVTLNANASNDGKVQIVDPLLGLTAGSFVAWMNANYTLYCSPYSDYANNKNILMALYSNTSMKMYVGDGANTSYSLTNANWSANEWHMIVATYNASTNKIALWIDLNKVSGSASGTNGSITHIGNTSDGGTYSALGRYQFQFGANQGFLNGSIDDVAFYNRSLTDSEIQSLYYSRFAGVTVKSNSDSSTGTIPDSGGNVNIPYSAGDGSVTSINMTVPSSITVAGTTIYDYTRTVSPVSYVYTTVSSQEYTPVTAFTGTPRSGTRPLVVSFTDSSTNFPTSWQWNFGDGSSNSTNQNPTHTYSNAGAYTVTLTTSNGQGSNTVSNGRYVLVYPQAGEAGVINNSKHIAIYLEGSSDILHDTGFGSMLHEYNITYLTNATLPGNLSTSNFDLLVVGSATNTVGAGYGSCSNSSAYYINNYITNGGCVWFINDPRNETNNYMVDASNSTWSLPASRFYCLGSITQANISASGTLNINTTDSTTAFIGSSTATALSTTNRWTDSRTFGGTDGVNAYGYRYTELIYYNGDATKCQLAKVWNDSTGSRVIYSNEQTFVSGGDCCYFNASTGSRLFNNLKTWILRLDNNSMGVSVTYPRGDKQLVCCFDDVDLSSGSLTPSLDNFFLMIAAQPNPIGITCMIIPTGRQSGTTPGIMVPGYQYLRSKGVDIDTIHPHQNDIDNPSPDSVMWYYNYAPLSDMQNSMFLYMQNYSTGVNDSEDLHWYSMRFPQTKTNTTSSQAVANLGFKITTSYGVATTMGSPAESHLNMRLLQKQKIINNVKTSCIEIEAPTSYDTSYAPGGDLAGSGAAGWTTACENTIPSFLALGFPSVYELNGHYQWSMNNTSFINSVRDILWYTDNRTEYTAYTDMATLAQYEIALQGAVIKIDTSGTTTTATITTSRAINDFTLKLQNISRGVKVYLDDSFWNDGALSADHVIYEDGVYYVFCDIPAGTHTLVIKDEPVTGGGVYVGKNGQQSVNISNGNYVRNNAATTKIATIASHGIYSNATNVMSATNNTVYTGGHNLSSQLNAVFVPSGGNVNVTVNDWNNTYKRWNESSSTHSATMLHVMGDFQPNEYVALIVDGVPLAEMIANSTGYVSCNYANGYSDHEFEAYAEGVSDITTVVSPNTTSMDLLGNVTVNVTGAVYTPHTSLLGSITSIIGGGYALASLVVIVLAALGIMRWLRFI